MIELTLSAPKPRLDTVLLEALRLQNDNHFLRNITRSQYKELFNRGKVRIKGQIARPSSGLAQGKTSIEILGYKQKDSGNP